MMNNLTLRQQTLVDLAKKSKVTIDVGCDHGYVGVSLLENGKTKFLIASDISEKCAKKTAKLLEEKNLSNCATTKVCDGIVLGKDESLDQAIIAGMGGKEIVHILENFKPKNQTHFVLQPMKELVLLRKFLSENGFKILKDFVIQEKGKFYHMLTAKLGSQKLSPSKQKWGAKPNCSEAYFCWLNQKQQKIENILKNMPKNNPKQEHFLRCLKEINLIKAKRRKLWY